MKLNKSKGFTLIEVLLVIGITGIITVFSGLNLIGFQRRTTIRTSADELISNLRKVQSLSIAAKDNTSYGVHFEQFYYEIFKGDSYIPSSSENVKVLLPRSVEILEVNLSPDDSVIFEKLSGYPDYTGSFNLVLGTETITMTINSEGLINVLETGNIEVPGGFGLISPVNGYLELNTLTSSFDWEDSSGSGITYQLWHSTNQSFTTKTTAYSGTTSAVTLPDNKKLADNTRNYWKVKATNDQGFVTWSTQTWFVDTQVSSSPTTFNLISPTNGESLVTTTPRLDWGNSTDPDGGNITYTLWIDDNSDFSSLLVEKVGLTISEYTIAVEDNLIGGDTYYWVVKAVDDNLVETWSTQQDWSFSISTGNVPTSFNLLSPENLALTSSSLPSFDWEDSIDPDGGDVTYNLWIDNNAEFSSLTLSKTNLISSDYTLVAGEELASGTYYWKVQAVDDESTTTWSNQEDWNFTIELNVAPSSFNLLSPASGTVMGSTEIIFDWEDSIDSNSSDAVTYTIIVDNNSNFASPEVSKSDLTSSNYSVTPLDNIQNGQTYYWKIIAKDGLLSTESNQTDWNFVVDADIYVDQSVSLSGDGTSWAKAFKTIGEALIVLTSGKTVNIAAGTYDQSILLTTLHSGTSSGRTRFIGKLGDAVTVTTSDTSGIVVNGTEYLTIENISFNGTNRYGAELRNGAYQVIFDNCSFSSNSYDGVYSPEATTSNIIVRNSTITNNLDNGFEIRGESFLLENNVVSNNVDDGLQANYLNNSIVRNTEFSNNGEYGIYINYGENSEVYENIIQDSGVDRASEGLYSYRTINLKFHHNTISGSRRRGIYTNELDRDIMTQLPSQIHHNVIYSSASDGLYANNSYRGYIYNNTIYGNSASGMYLQRFNGLLIVRNNNLSGNDSGFRVRNGNGNLNHNYANAWGNTQDFRDQGSTYAGVNTISVNPLFVNAGAGNFNLQAGSGCINTGDPSAFYNDPDGTRSDINALHYTQ